MKSVNFKLVFVFLFVCVVMAWGGVNANVTCLDSYDSEDRALLDKLWSDYELVLIGSSYKFDEDFRLFIWVPDISKNGEINSKFVAIIECSGEDLAYEEISLYPRPENKIYYFFDKQIDVKEISAKFENNSGINELKWYRLIKKMD
ncbi:MAG: hypothetical protein ABH827_04215 [bacterium]